jgi:hypothetical protein
VVDEVTQGVGACIMGRRVFGGAHVKYRVVR